MGFLGLTKPKWKHADAEVRLRAIQDLPDDKEGLLADLARTDLDARVRAASASRVKRADLLTRLLSEGDDAVKRIAGERLSGAAETLLRVKPWAEIAALMERVQDQKSLADLTLTARDTQVREQCFERLLKLPEPSPTLLATIAIQDAAGTFAVRAVARIDRRSDLKTVVAKAKAPAVRDAAKARIEALVSDDRPSPEQVRTARLKQAEPLVAEALRLAVGTEWTRLDDAWASLRARWAALTTDRPDVPAGAKLAELAERVARAEADHRRRAAEATMRAEAEAKRLADLEAARAAQAAQVVATTPEAPAEPAALLISPADEEALATLSDEAEQLVTAGREARFRFQELHKHWSRLAHGLPLQDARRLRFLNAYQGWKQARAEAMTTRNSQRDERKATLTALIAEVEALAAAEAGTTPADHDRRANAVKDLQGRWRKVGALPPTVVEPLRERFRAACDQAWAPVAVEREALAWERTAHLGHAEDLITQVEALATVEDLAQVANGVKQAHAAWKKLGSLPKDKGQAAWLRFKAACDTQFDRCTPHFEAQDAARAANLEAKKALIAEVTALLDEPSLGLTGSPADLADQKRRGEAITAAQDKWKSIGAVPREADQDLWRSWRTVLDRFYGARRAAFDARHAEQVANLNQKLGLMSELETLAGIAEAGQTEPGKKKPDHEVHARLRDLQQAWKNIGHVPRDHVETTWEKWRTTCDRVYATLKDYLAAQEAERQANLEAKLVLIKEVEDLSTLENPHWFKDDVREAQVKWRAVGYIPREKMDEVNDRFRTACDKILRAEG